MATATVSRNEIKGMSGPQLVETYNSLVSSDEQVKRFSTRAAGIKRTIAALDANGAGEAAPLRKSNKAAAKVDVVSVGEVARKRRLTFPAKSHIKNHRSGTSRAKVIQMLSRENGATIQQIMDAIDWDYRTAFEGVKLIHAYVGYGLEEDDKGRIRLIGEPTA